MNITTLPLGSYQTNCYILTNDNNNAIIIDPGSEPEKLIKHLDNNNITVKMIALTHGHFDHVGAITKLKAATNAPIYIHKDDNEMLLDPDLVHPGLTNELNRICGFDCPTADKFFVEGEKYSVDDMKFEVMHVPGHTKGSTILIFDDVMFTGDTIFEGTVGRTDLHGGSSKELRDSAKRVAGIKGEYVMHCGHGGATTLAKEKATNMYMVDNYADLF